MEDNVSTVEMEGFSVDLRTDTPTELQRARTFSNESQLVEAILEELRPDDRFWDVGANIGLFTLFASEVIETGEIHSFEPHKANFQSLNSNIERECPDIAFAHNIALFDEDGWVHFDPVDPTVGEGHGHITEEGGMKVQCIRGDSLQYRPPDVVKIDVEGAEMRVLKGMNHITDDIRAIFIEAHPSRMVNRYGNSVGDIIDFSHRMEFKTSLLFSRGNEKFFKLHRDG